MNKTSIPQATAIAVALVVTCWQLPALHADSQSGSDTPAAPPSAKAPSAARLNDDYAAMKTFRPGYSFWQQIFTIPDGSIAYGSAVDGRLLAVFPTRGDWVRQAKWIDPSLAHVLDGHTLSKVLDKRREQVAQLLEQAAGPIVHNPTRGLFLLPNAQRYGDFLGEWSAIYGRFGVPGEIGLAQAAVESGLNGTRRSKARAIGFCQWLARNWQALNHLSPYVIEGNNQTTQAPYCAAYLTILATKYGSFIPALSEHHAGGTNVGRTLINGSRLGGEDIRNKYFIGSQFARDLRQISLQKYADIYRTYGPRSYAYAEMVFGNTSNIRTLQASKTQTKIYAMRADHAITIAEIRKRTGLTLDDIKRFNPALLQQVPKRGTLYLPVYVKEFGTDVSFWHTPATDGYAAALDDFLHINASLEQWDDPAFEPVLKGFQKRFAQTNTEEGTVFATVLAYVIDEAYSSRRGAILAEFKNSEHIHQLFDKALADWNAMRTAQASTPLTQPAGN